MGAQYARKKYFEVTKERELNPMFEISKSNIYVSKFLIHLWSLNTVSLWLRTAICISALVSWLFWKNPLLSEPNEHSLYGHCWWIPTSAHLVNWDVPSALLSLLVRVLIRASGNQKTHSMVTDKNNKENGLSWAISPKAEEMPYI